MYTYINKEIKGENNIYDQYSIDIDENAFEIIKEYANGEKVLEQKLINSYFIDRIVVDEDEQLNELDNADNRKQRFWNNMLHELKNDKKEINLTEEQLSEIYDNLFWDNMEVIVFKDNTINYRQQNSFSEFEDEIVLTMPLDNIYWSIFKDDYENMDKFEFIKEELIPELQFNYII